MKEKVENIVLDAIKPLGVYVDDCFISEEEGCHIFNIVIDSKDVIDLKKITEVSKIINPLLDKTDLIGDCCEVDIYSKEKGENHE